MVNLNDLNENWYHYQPSIAASAVFVAVFAIVTISHAAYAWRTGSRYFIPLTLGGFCEVAAFCIRAGAHNYLTDIVPYIIQELLMLLAPISCAATIYMILSRLIRATQAEHLSPIQPRKLTLLFVIADLLCLSVQGNGGSLEAKYSADVREAGRWITGGGLLLQIFAFAGFVYIASLVDRRLRAQPTNASQGQKIKWKQCMAVLYTVSALIVLRNLERTVEHAEGTGGWLISHEPMLLCFDAVPMSTLMVILLIWHPSRLVGEGHQRQSLRSQVSTMEIVDVEEGDEQKHDRSEA